jgi:hypothetical protein
VEVVSVQNNVTGIPAVTFSISDNATDVDIDNATVQYGEGGFFSEYGSQTDLTHVGGDRYRATLFDPESDTRSLGGIDYQLTVSDTVGNNATYNDTLVVKPVVEERGRFIGLSLGDGSAAADYETNLLEDQIASTTFDSGTRIAINKLATKAGVSGGASIGAAVGKLAGLGVGILFSIPGANPPSRIDVDTLGGQASQTAPFVTGSRYNQTQPVFIALSRTLGVETYSQVRVTVQSETGDSERVVREYDELSYPSDNSSAVPRGNVLIPTEPLSFEDAQLQPGEERTYTIRAYLWREDPDVSSDVGMSSTQITVVGTSSETAPAEGCPTDENSGNLRCIEYGQSVTSRLDSSDEPDPDVTGFYYEPVTFFGSAGDEVIVNVSSRVFDPAMTELHTPNGTVRDNPGGLANPVTGPPYRKGSTFTLAETGEYELRIGNSRLSSFGEYELTLSEALSDPDEPTGETVTVSVTPSSLTAGTRTDVTVTVEDASGGAVPGATVEITGVGLSATTGANGEATLSLSDPTAGEYTVSVSADGYAGATATLTVESSGESGGGSGGLPTGPGEPGFGEVLEVIQAFNTDSEYADSRVTPGFGDVLEVIQAFNAG